MNLRVRPLLRYLWKQRLFTALNVIGLAIGIGACWVIYSIVSYENSFDKNMPDLDKTFRLVTLDNGDKGVSRFGGVIAPLYQSARQQAPQVKRIVPVFEKWFIDLRIDEGDGRSVRVIDDPKNIVEVDTTYFAMQPYSWLAGNAENALASPENVVLTLSRAKSYFGNYDPELLIGRRISYYGLRDTVNRVVTGIVRDLDHASEFNAREFLPINQLKYNRAGNWNNVNAADRIYVQMYSNADTAKVCAIITRLLKDKSDQLARENGYQYQSRTGFQLLPMRDLHFSTDIDGATMHRASKTGLLGLMGMGLFILLLAGINYVNLTTAQIPQRTKEIGIRKVLGVDSSKLIGRIMIETLATVLFAVMLSALFVWLAFQYLGDMIPEGARAFSVNATIIIFLMGIVVFVTLCTGFYPTWLIAKMQPLEIVRHKTTWNSAAGGLNRRKLLIVIQFVIAQVFIAGALIVNSQLKYTLEKDLGFQKEAVVLVEVPWKIGWKITGKEDVMKSQLSQIAGIRTVSLSDPPLSDNFNSSGYKLTSATGDPIDLRMIRRYADSNFLRVYELKLLAGRNLRNIDSIPEAILNESAVKQYGFSSPNDAIGKLVGQEEKLSIVGVVKDFHSGDFRNTIQPLILLSEKPDGQVFNIKLEKANAEWRETIAKIQQTWNRFYPADSFNYSFYDQAIEALYHQEQELRKLINLATAIAILVSCLGLFGLASLTAVQKAKEISIRKVLGASITGVVALLSKDFVRLILVALFIAAPIAWWLLNKWLENFVYRVDVKWWYFAYTGAAAISVALLTVSYQSIKAATANPVDRLRNE